MRHDVQRLVWRSQAGLACDRAFPSGFSLLLPHPHLSAGRGEGDTAPALCCADIFFHRVAERRAKARNGGAAGERTALTPDRREHPGGLLDGHTRHGRGALRESRLREHLGAISGKLASTAAIIR